MVKTKWRERHSTQKPPPACFVVMQQESFHLPMVFCKSENLYKNWIKGSPKNAVYDVTLSGWFDNRIFEIWFFKLFVPAVNDRGKVALIGDNLGSHFSKAVIDKSVWKRIYILCLPPNATFCQPLDVAVFPPAKSEWHNILDTWCKETRSKENLPKTVLPQGLF